MQEIIHRGNCDKKDDVLQLLDIADDLNYLDIVSLNDMYKTENEP